MLSFKYRGIYRGFVRQECKFAFFVTHNYFHVTFQVKVIVCQDFFSLNCLIYYFYASFVFIYVLDSGLM